MTEWTYYAGSRAPLQDGLEILRRHGLMWRGSRNVKGALVANVARLRSGDILHFCFRDRHGCRYIFKAVIGEPQQPAEGTWAIDRIAGVAAEELIRAGYPRSSDGAVEVIRLQEVDESVGVVEVLPPPSQQAIWGHSPRLAQPGSQWPSAISESMQPSVGRTERPRSRSRHGHRVTRTTPPSALLSTAPEERGRAVFDRYIAVDWSARKTPARGSDSIWIAEATWQGDRRWREEVPQNPSTRQAAFEWLAARLGLPGRTLVGFDFAFGYPAGFAARLPGSAMQEPWRRTAEFLSSRVKDDPDNTNNRHDVAAEINGIVGGGPGPFWGCHEGAASEWLTPRRVGVFEFPYRGLDEYRLTDRYVVSRGTPLVSVWKIDQGISVGGQTLMGIPYLMWLRDAVRSSGRSFRVWPFETGWLPSHGGVTAVEMFPSLLAGRTPADEHIKDRHQVRECIARFGLLDSVGELGGRFARPSHLSHEDEAKVRGEEGWIFLA